MKNEKEKWIEEVVQSMEGSQRAKPRLGLFAKIQEQTVASHARIISSSHWRNYAAAAVLIILMNTTALVLYNRNHKSPVHEAEAISLYNEPINISFQIYN